MGETKQQSRRELEQLDVRVEANVNPLPNKWPSSEAWKQDGHAKGSGWVMEEWSWGKDREKAQKYNEEDWFSYSGGVIQSYPGGV